MWYIFLRGKWKKKAYIRIESLYGTEAADEILAGKDRADDAPPAIDPGRRNQAAESV